MASSRLVVAGLMVLLASTSAQSLPTIRSNINSRLPARLVHSGTTLTIVRKLCFAYVFIVNKPPSATQYCDGLRGAMVVYDPNDPHKSKSVKFAQ